MKAREVIARANTQATFVSGFDPSLFVAALAEAGFVIVPKEPTEGMIEAIWLHMPDYEPSYDNARNAYSAMLQAYSKNGEGE